MNSTLVEFGDRGKFGLPSTPKLATIHRLQARTSARLDRIATICRVFNGDWNTGRGVPDALSRLLTIQCGVVSRKQMAKLMSWASLRHLVKSGRWRNPHRGVFLAHNGIPTDQQRLWVASLAAGGGRPALLGGRTALAAMGMKGFATDSVHVLLGAAQRELNPPPGVVVHRTRTLAARDIYRAVRPPCTTVARSVVDAASWARSDDEARTVIAMVFQQQMTTLAEITAVLDRMPRAKRRRLVLRHQRRRGRRCAFTRGAGGAPAHPGGRTA